MSRYHLPTRQRVEEVNARLQIAAEWQRRKAEAERRLQRRLIFVFAIAAVVIVGTILCLAQRGKGAGKPSSSQTGKHSKGLAGAARLDAPALFPTGGRR